jgi:type VI secretion system protein ImpB
MGVNDEIPKSRITLTYKTEVQGEPAVVDLPFRLLVLGDFSGGSSKDRQVDYYHLAHIINRASSNCR